jgi:hypothetical protein
MLHSTILRFRVLCKYLNLVCTIYGDSFYRKLFGTLSHKDLGNFLPIFERQASTGNDSAAGLLFGRERFTAGFVDRGGAVASDRSLALLPGREWGESRGLARALVTVTGAGGGGVGPTR